MFPLRDISLIQALLTLQLPLWNPLLRFPLVLFHLPLLVLVSQSIYSRTFLMIKILILRVAPTWVPWRLLPLVALGLDHPLPQLGWRVIPLTVILAISFIFVITFVLFTCIIIIDRRLHLDADDTATFAVVLTNVGHSRAFNVSVHISLTEYIHTSEAISNLCVRFGGRGEVDYAVRYEEVQVDGLGTVSRSLVVDLIDPIFGDGTLSASATDGSNIVIITLGIFTIFIYC